MFASTSCCPSNWDLFVMNADGTGQVQFTSGPEDSLDPAWSPDGTSIAFSHDPDIHSDIHVMQSDGSNPVNVGHDPGSGGPAWQPIPDRPPDCSGVRVTPQSLAPPNHKFVTVTLSGGMDPDGDPVRLIVTSVTQDEPVGRRPDARAGPLPNQVRLRSERKGRGDGRVYRIAFKMKDGKGASCRGKVKVGVPKGREAAVDSAPPSYRSL